MVNIPRIYGDLGDGLLLFYHIYPHYRKWKLVFLSYNRWDEETHGMLGDSTHQTFHGIGLVGMLTGTSLDNSFFDLAEPQWDRQKLS